MESVAAMIDSYIENIRVETGISFDIKEPFDYEYYKKLRPKGMRQKKYKQELAKLHILYRKRAKVVETDEPVTPFTDGQIRGAISGIYILHFWMCYEYGAKEEALPSDATQ